MRVDVVSDVADPVSKMPIQVNDSSHRRRQAGQLFEAASQPSWAISDVSLDYGLVPPAAFALQLTTQTKAPKVTASGSATDIGGRRLYSPTRGTSLSYFIMRRRSLSMAFRS